MILDQVTLHDFGVYAGVQQMALTPPDPAKPVILVGGLNGAGKTTLMDALQLCLLGPAARCAARSNVGYQQYLAQCINKRSRWLQASVTMIFRRMEDGEEARYRVIRSWKKTGTRVSEHLEVSRNRQTSKALVENWPALAQDILPPSISHLFFFDGEQIEAYASPEGAQELVSVGVRNLLGMDLVSRLQKDLVTLERKKKGEVIPASDMERIQAKEGEKQRLQYELDLLAEKRAALRTHKLEPSKQKLHAKEEEYKSLGGEARDRREAINRRAVTAELSLAASMQGMAELAEKALPYVLIGDLLDDVVRQCRVENSVVQAKLAAQVLQNNNAEMIKVAQGVPNSSQVVAALKKFNEAAMAEWSQMADKDVLLELNPGSQALLSSVLETGLQDLFADAKQMLEMHTALQDELDASRLEQASIPLEESVAALAAERDALLRDVSRLETEIAEIESAMEKTRAALTKCESELEDLWTANAETRLAHKSAIKYIHRTQAARETLQQFESAVLQSQIGHVERLALDSYLSLLRKEGLLSSIRINPDAFSIALRDAEGRPIPSERLSAGERQLLAISLLWGMAKASGRVLPVAIDTPMGRLDSEHRARLVSRYFPHASHQVLLFSTDEEISGEYLEMLRPHIGRSYRLDYSNESAATVIQEGYLP